MLLLRFAIAFLSLVGLTNSSSATCHRLSGIGEYLECKTGCCFAKGTLKNLGSRGKGSSGILKATLSGNPETEKALKAACSSEDKNLASFLSSSPGIAINLQSQAPSSSPPPLPDSENPLSLQFEGGTTVIDLSAGEIDAMLLGGSPELRSSQSPNLQKIKNNLLACCSGELKNQFNSVILKGFSRDPQKSVFIGKQGVKCPSSLPPLSIPRVACGPCETTTNCPSTLATGLAADLNRALTPHPPTSPHGSRPRTPTRAQSPTPKHPPCNRVAGKDVSHSCQTEGCCLPETTLKELIELAQKYSNTHHASTSIASRWADQLSEKITSETFGPNGTTEKKQAFFDWYVKKANDPNEGLSSNGGPGLYVAMSDPTKRGDSALLDQIKSSSNYANKTDPSLFFLELAQGSPVIDLSRPEFSSKIPSGKSSRDNFLGCCIPLMNQKTPSHLIVKGYNENHPEWAVISGHNAIAKFRSPEDMGLCDKLKGQDLKQGWGEGAQKFFRAHCRSASPALSDQKEPLLADSAQAKAHMISLVTQPTARTPAESNRDLVRALKGFQDVTVAMPETGRMRTRHLDHLLRATNKEDLHDTIESHSLAVMDGFFSRSEEWKDVSSPQGVRDLNGTLRLSLALHDIGKPINPEHQHEETEKIMQKVQTQLGLTEAESRLMNSLVMQDTLGEYIRIATQPGVPKVRKSTQQAKALDQITQSAKACGMTPRDFYKIQRTFYEADAGYYPGLKPFLDPTVGPNGQKKGLAYPLLDELDKLLQTTP